MKTPETSKHEPFADVTGVHITICICTYKRPLMLERLLKALDALETGEIFTYSIVIVDNDVQMSAKDTVEQAKNTYDTTIEYIVEPEQNISIARNRTVEKAKGNYIAFIDDDEWPEPAWLKNHFLTLRTFGADGSFGPVLPYFDAEPPKWLVDGGFCVRPSHKTGMILESTSCRTGNGFVSHSLFAGEGDRFDPGLGRSGGEDGQFFLKMILSGRKFVWCHEAPVHEVVPPERWKASYYIRRQMRIGGVSGELERKTGLRENPLKTLKAVLRIHLYFVFFSIAVLPSLVVRKDLGVKCLTKMAYSLAFVFGFWGLVLIREKNE